MTLVVENIPKEHLTVPAIKGYFAKFGEVTEVSVEPFSGQALVTFADSNVARSAHNSPDPVFQNRFVRVYFQRKNDDKHTKYTAPGLQTKAAEPTAGNDGNDVAMQSAESTTGETGPSSEAPIPPGVSADKAELLRSLREKAAALGIDISSLGSGSTAPDPASSYVPRGRGRGRGRASYRGSWAPPAGRGRGGPAMGAMKLDNRTTVLSVVGLADTDAKDKLRPYFEVSISAMGVWIAPDPLSKQFGSVVGSAPLPEPSTSGDFAIKFASRTAAEKASLPFL